jgi:hypothetical protein
VSLASEHHVSLEIPELGPYLGRLVAPPVIETGQRHWIPLEDIRYELVTEVFVRSGEAREWCAADDPDLTIATLGRSVWLGLWERALTAVSQRASQAINARLEAAAAESRMPGRLRRRLPLGPDEAFALHSRLDAGSGPFREAVDRLETAAHAARAAQGKGPAAENWSNLLTTVARRLESAWLCLEEAAEKEWVRWAGDVEEVRAWRRPMWPLVLISLLILATAAYVGLLLGGYLPVPGPLEGPVEWVWERWS